MTGAYPNNVTGNEPEIAGWTHCSECERCISERDAERLKGCLEDAQRLLQAAHDVLGDTTQVVPDETMLEDGETVASVLNPLAELVDELTNYDKQVVWMSSAQGGRLNYRTHAHGMPTAPTIERAIQRIRACEDEAHRMCRYHLAELKAGV
jgi:hypothetical protein